ncbi:sensor histidine kinase [Clostridium ihumii]|uniref:sensor histidine kinase n=1 Tax=Clostridium ihumii TaxID=1470356 RepID=UPI00058C5EE3|nr:sensor histidine kinase [Clostridium ihumii]
MKLFIKDNLGFILIYIFSFVLVFSSMLIFQGFNTIGNCIYFVFLNLFVLTVYMLYRYYKNRKLYNGLSNKYNNFEEIVNEFGNSYLGNELNRLTNDMYGFYQGEVNNQIKNQKEQLDFMNQWVHHMKTPLSVIKLYMQEYEDEEFVDDIKSEVDKLERGLKLALYNARLEDFRNDFSLKKFELQGVIKESVNSLKSYFIKNKIFPKVQIEDNIIINSDKKWIEFILEQILINSIKYSVGKGKYVEIMAKKENEKVVIEIIDDGIGISKRDIKRVFEPFYTGSNGREYGESTGMGLHLVKDVCEKLNHEIYIESEEGVGTRVKLVI